MGVCHGCDPPEKLRFGNFEVDLDAGELRKNGLRVKLPDQAFEVLTALLEQAGEVVTREQLQQKLWPADTLVDFDHGLNKTINRIREALCDSASTPRFLETVPRRGYRFIAAVEEIAPSPVEPKPPAMNAVLGVTALVRRAPFARKHIRWAAVIAFLAALVAAIPATNLLHHRNTAALSTRSSILIDPASMASMWGLSLSPDGRWVTFSAPSGQARGAVSVLWVRPLDSLAARAFPIPGVDRAFWSPDSRYIAFWDARTLKIMEVSGGYPVAISDFGDDRGGTWSRYGVILFAGFNPGPIYRIPAKGGTPEAVTRIDKSRGEISHRWPFFLPDGHHFVYSSRLSLDGTYDEANTIRVASLDGRTNKFLLYADSNAIYSQGYLLFVRNHRLMAQPFDAATLSTTRYAVPIAEPIAMAEDYGDFYASASGALVYRTGADFGSRLVWLDRKGKQIGSLANSGRYYRPRIAPDGRAIAVDVRNSYSWVRQALQGAGLVEKRRRRGPHRRRRERRPLPGMLLHIDGSRHQWFQDDRWYDLLVILDDATSEIYYAQLVEEESTRTVMAGLREVIENQGLFCALYSDRGSHFFVTPKAGEPVDKHRLTQVGRAMKELGVQMIPAYSPQARGRSERSFGTWQGRLPQELRVAGITTPEAANRFLRERYMAEFHEKFAVKAARPGTAFRRCRRSDLNWIFTVQTERVMAKDNTVAIADRRWQIEKTGFRNTLAGCTVTIHEHLDGKVSIRYGPHVIGRFDENGERRGKVESEKPASHFSTATAATAALSPKPKTPAARAA